MICLTFSYSYYITMCNCMLSIIVNNYSKSEREKNVFAFIPGLKSEVFPLTHIRPLYTMYPRLRTISLTRTGEKHRAHWEKDLERIKSHKTSSSIDLLNKIEAERCGLCHPSASNYLGKCLTVESYPTCWNSGMFSTPRATVIGL